MEKFINAVMKLRARISRNDVCEDTRKVGVAGIITGIIGVFASGDHLSAENGLALFFVGCIIWVIGLTIRRNKS